MIYVKPRKMMNVERMRKQREKHHPLRFMTWYFDRQTLEDMYPEVRDFVLDELKEQFMIDVRRWNFSRKARLGAVTCHVDYDIDFDRTRVIFEIRRVPKGRDLARVVELLTAQQILTPNEIREAMGWPRR